MSSSSSLTEFLTKYIDTLSKIEGAMNRIRDANTKISEHYGKLDQRLEALSEKYAKHRQLKKRLFHFRNDIAAWRDLLANKDVDASDLKRARTDIS